VILEVQSPLVGLLSGLEGVEKIFSKGQVLPYFDYQCPMLSLPLAFNSDIKSIPNKNPYLFSTQDKKAAWFLKLGEKKNPRIGLVWSGNAQYKNDKIRSIQLSELIRYLPHGFEYISLQKVLREGDLQLLSNNSIRHFGEELSDFSDTAALCDLMDVVVSVDTGVAHLSGALGKLTWVLLPYKSDFRWLLDRDDSPWYPSVKLYRQSEGKRWDEVIDIISRDLLKLFH
jgi:ADP-heptose:LPS heptosyltransferase